MRSRVIKSLYKKEMLDVLRDKKTVVMMLVVPIILYPLLMLVGMLTMTKISTDIETRTYKVAFSKDVSDELIGYFDEGATDEYSFFVYEDVAPEEAQLLLEQEKIDVYVTLQATDMSAQETEKKAVKERYQIDYLSSVNNSGYGADRVQSVLASYSRDMSKRLLEKAGLDADYILNPVELKLADKAKAEESAGNLMGTIIPFMLIVSLLMGTMYPAIDTTAGERERGTLETMLTLPISNQELIFSKFLTVATIGVASAILNLISMGGVSSYMYHIAVSVGGMNQGINFVRFIPAVIIGVLCILAFAIFVSAITMCVCAFARTYKEANNYITPLMLVILFASFASMLPNLVLNARTALVPVVNICLLIRDILSFKYNFAIIALVLASNTIYGILSVLFLGRIYKSEGILFGESLAGIRIFERRCNMKKGQPVAMGELVIVLAVELLAVIYVGGAASLASVYKGIIITQLLIFSIPVLAAWYTKCDMRQTFKLKAPKPRELVAAVFMVIGAMLLGMVLTAIVGSIFTGSAQNAMADTGEYMKGGFGISVLLVAVLPAICEETLFRGYVMSAFVSRFGKVTAIIGTACIFGLYHMSIVKFFTTALLGAVFCYVVYETRSILPAILMHFINNATACVQMYYPEIIEKYLPVFAGEAVTLQDMALILAMGIVMLVTGKMILNMGCRKIEK